MTMNICKRLTVLGLICLAAMGCQKAAKNDTRSIEYYKANIEKTLAKMDAGVAAGPYKADWESLKAHKEAPEWFLDGKIGIYFHWGVYSVPAYGNEWYPKWMHVPEGKKTYYKHHVETYGEPDEFGYHDFVPMFKAEKFDADEWARLFKETGARWAGPVCEHHDGFSMWDSDITPWNSADKGPKRDITGELEKAIKGRDMKFVTTFHHERTRTWYPRVEGWPTTSDDPILQFMYMNIDETLFNKIFQAKLGEVIDKYKPDLIWFDGQMIQIQDPYHLDFLAYYFNQAKKWGKDVMVTTKKRQYPEEISVMDFEKGRANALTPWPWLIDDTISDGSWCYTENLNIKPASRVIDDFIDSVSKNGHLLLNISPKSDGTIPQNQRDVLKEIGKWLKVNGEAIYETRPWLAFGEGPNRLKKSGSFSGAVEYSGKDIRYTRSKDNKILYATILGWPDNGKVVLSYVKADRAKHGKVSLIGSDKKIKFTINKQKQPVIDVSAIRSRDLPCDYAWSFKLEGFEMSLQAKAIEIEKEIQKSQDLIINREQMEKEKKDKASMKKKSQ
jgi:alpha-L-fucosidase